MEYLIDFGLGIAARLSVDQVAFLKQVDNFFNKILLLRVCLLLELFNGSSLQIGSTVL